MIEKDLSFNLALFPLFPKVIDLLNPGTARKPLAVRWSKKSRGFFVENLFTVDCEELDDLLAVLEEGTVLRMTHGWRMNNSYPAPSVGHV